MMENKPMDSVHYFVRGLFRGITETDRVSEQKEELEAHINDRISDCIDRGIPYDAAFSQVVESLGNLDELIETMSGRGKKIYDKKADWFFMAGGIVYGTLYMTAVGIWFSFHSLGPYAVYIAIPGWLGFVIPALIKLMGYLKNPKATAVVSLDRKNEVRSAFIGWAIISASCWAINILLFNSSTLMTVIWAWMPTFGLLTWPLMESGYSWMIRNLKAIECESSRN
jgi:hypothetical protein